MATIAIDAEALRNVECARTGLERVSQIARASACLGGCSQILIYDSSQETNRLPTIERGYNASASEIGATLDALVTPRSIAGTLRRIHGGDDDDVHVEGGRRKRRRMTMMGWIAGARRASTFTTAESTSRASRYREGVVVEGEGTVSERKKKQRRRVEGEGAVSASAGVTVTVDLGDGFRVEAGGVKRKPPVGARVFVRADDGDDGGGGNNADDTKTTTNRTWTIVSPREPRKVTGDYYGYDAQPLAPGAKLPRDDFSCVILVDSLFTPPAEPSQETIAAFERAKSTLTTDPDSVLIVFGTASSSATASLRPDVVVDPLCQISHKSPHNLRQSRGVHVDESVFIVLARLFTPGYS